MVDVSVDPARRCPVAEFESAGGKRAPLAGHEELDEARGYGPVVEVEDGNGFVFQQGKGFLMVTSYEDILAVAQNPGVFSNNVNKDIPGATALIPEELDGELHMKWRRLLTRDFSPGQVKLLDGKMRQIVNDLIDKFIDKGECDLIKELSLEFPTSIFLAHMGMDQSMLPQYVEWAQAILHPDPANLMHAFETQGKVKQYFAGVIAEKRAALAAGTGDDGLITRSLSFEIDGGPVTDVDLLSLCLLLFQAGLDTVTAELGYSFHHLATHPEDRQHLIDHPEDIPLAVEEFLRLYGMVSPPRIATEDAMIGTCPVSKGDRIALAFPAAGRDENTFDNPLVMDLQRPAMTHLGFGAGPHRCIGSNLARLEMVIALEEWHKRIPHYTLTPGAHLDENVSEILGLNNLPLSWEPA